MRRLTVLLMVLCATAGVAACGGDDDSADGSKGGEPAPVPASLTKCLEDAGLEVEGDDGGLVRAKDPESDATTEITNFDTGAEASEFANKQDIATQAGKVVAVYSSNTDPTQTRVDKCISTAS